MSPALLRPVPAKPDRPPHSCRSPGSHLLTIGAAARHIEVRPIHVRGRPVPRRDDGLPEERCLRIRGFLEPVPKNGNWRGPTWIVRHRHEESSVAGNGVRELIGKFFETRGEQTFRRCDVESCTVSTRTGNSRQSTTFTGEGRVPWLRQIQLAIMELSRRIASAANVM